MGVFDQIGAARVPRSAFNLSYEKKFTADLGELIPVLCDEVVPGDIWEIGNSAIVRLQPMIAPIMHRLDVRFYTFFVPYRILDDNWVEFITRGVDGDQVITLPVMDPDDAGTPANVVAKGTLWDYFGFPTGIVPHASACPLDYPRRAYNMVWNQYFRDENLQTELDITDIENHVILKRNWDKDYFTSGLASTQKGTAVALPVIGSGSVVFDFPFDNITGDAESSLRGLFINPANDPQDVGTRGYDGSFGSGDTDGTGAILDWEELFSDNNAIDVGSLTAMDIADLRLSIMTQVWMERNNRAGNRYIELLMAHFGVSPNDQTLQRAHYVGGSSTPVMISEVLQTSEDGTTPQGNMAGHGLSVASSEIGRYRAEEYGLMLTLCCVVPQAVYQQGINRQWLRRETWDFYFPEFANLSEQEILNEELYVVDQATDTTGALANGVFAYTGRYNEMRFKPNMVCGDMRDDYDHWHISRQFAAAPSLNSAFIECSPRKEYLAVPTEPALIMSVGNHLNVLRPMPWIAEPMSFGGI